jgi:predicted dinucleotide-binding enzyme
MTSFAFTAADHRFITLDREPRRSFAARLASLQALAESTDVPDAVTLAGRVVFAAVPFGMLAWLFVAV